MNQIAPSFLSPALPFAAICLASTLPVAEAFPNSAFCASRCAHLPSPRYQTCYWGCMATQNNNLEYMTGAIANGARLAANRAAVFAEKVIEGDPETLAHLGYTALAAGTIAIAPHIKAGLATIKLGGFAIGRGLLLL